MIFGLIVAVPTLIVSGPLLAQFVHRLVPIQAGNAGALVGQTDEGVRGEADTADPATREPSDRGAVPLSKENPDSAADARPVRRPAFVAAVACMVLPVLLMLVKAIGDLVIDNPDASSQKIVDFIGTPSVALLVAILFAMFALGRGSGMRRDAINDSLGAGLPAVASIMLIVAAGGGFKQVLSDSGVSNVIADWAKGSHISVLLLGWLVAVGVRLATGSATVATITTAGIVGKLGSTLDDPHLALLVLAVGSGSLFFSHVNDAGFWLVKEYFGMTVWQTIKSWSVMETVVSVVAFGCVMILDVIV